MRKETIGLVLLVGVLALAACAEAPQLDSLSAGNPEGVDLSGSWQIRVEGRGPLVREGEQPQTIRMPERATRRSAQQRQRRPQRAEGDDVWIFIETGKALKITQTIDGLFISFDRSVVEEFTFGENLIVSVGPIKAMRVSGWEEQAFVVETVDKTGTTLYEAWHLDADSAVLMRDVRISKGEEDSYTLRQIFDRQ